MNYKETDDLPLVNHLREHPNDQQGWQVLLERYDRLIWYWMPNTDEDAKDLRQEIQIAIWDGLLNRFEGTGTVLSYVGSVIVNKVKGRRRGALREVLGNEVDEIANQIPDSHPEADPAQHATNQEAGKQIANLLQHLKAKEQKMLILRYLGYDHHEIHLTLNIKTEGASRKFLHKLVKKITKHCLKLGIDPAGFKAGMLTLFEEGELHEILSQ
jgi:RNA polymerase sigma factor (sigma-70 family)